MGHEGSHTSKLVRPECCTVSKRSRMLPSCTLPARFTTSCPLKKRVGPLFPAVNLRVNFILLKDSSDIHLCLIEINRLQEQIRIAVGDLEPFTASTRSRVISCQCRVSIPVESIKLFPHIIDAEWHIDIGFVYVRILVVGPVDLLGNVGTSIRDNLHQTLRSLRRCCRALE